MKNWYYFFAFTTLLCITACSSESEAENSDNTEKEKDKATQMGQKVPAPVINIGEFSEMSKADLRLARNTIYAKYGRVFKSKDLKDHFAKQDWYHERADFKESDLRQQDLDIVNLIKCWEEKTKILLEEQVDITGNGSYENCFVLYNKNKGTYSILLNDFSQEFDHFWGQNEDNQGVPSDWAELEVEVIDIDPEDFKQEIRVSQRFDDWEDPGTHNVIVAFHDGVKVSELSSTDYDSGVLTLNGDGTVTMQQSNCPEHTKEFRLERGTLVQFDENIGPTPPGGCAACFSGDAQVATSMSTSKAINELQRGDIVLTYDETSQSYLETYVERILSVYHENLVRIEIGETELVVTDDHPFLTTKGWCSLYPEKTMERYGYQDVTLLSSGSELVGITANESMVSNIEPLDEGMMTYTISTLENGTTFIVNGVVVGTESFNINL
ncbi:MAG: hypothetical protein Crog4KO_04740 [Crocinitomicaceae bacterium]